MTRKYFILNFRYIGLAIQVAGIVTSLTETLGRYLLVSWTSIGPTADYLFWPTRSSPADTSFSTFFIIQIIYYFKIVRKPNIWPSLQREGGHAACCVTEP